MPVLFGVWRGRQTDGVSVALGRELPRPGVLGGSASGGHVQAET